MKRIVVIAALALCLALPTAAAAQDRLVNVSVGFEADGDNHAANVFELEAKASDHIWISPSLGFGPSEVALAGYGASFRLKPDWNPRVVPFFDFYAGRVNIDHDWSTVFAPGVGVDFWFAPDWGARYINWPVSIYGGDRGVSYRPYHQFAVVWNIQ